MNPNLTLRDKVQANKRSSVPVLTYWLIRQHGELIVQKLSEGGGSVNQLGKQLDVSRATLGKVIDFIDGNMAVVAKFDWIAVEDILFGPWPGFRNSVWYHEQISAGYDAFLARRAVVKRPGVKLGSKFPNRQKRPGVMDGAGEFAAKVSPLVPSTLSPAKGTRIIPKPKGNLPPLITPSERVFGKTGTTGEI